jgi:Family of unknown function (DUF5989)
VILLIAAGVIISMRLRPVDRAWMALAHLISKVTIGALLVFAQGSALAPFIYTIF